MKLVTMRTMCLSTMILWLLGLGVSVEAEAAGYESTGTVRAADYLPEKAMAGKEWKVAAEATNDGAVNTYVVESRFGNFEARGQSRVAIRGREVDALVELERISKTDVFTDAVKASALGSVETVKQFATKPVETVKAVPSAMGRWFKKTKFQVEETYVDAKEAKAERDRQEAEKKAKEEEGDLEEVAAEEAAQREERQEKGEEAAKGYALNYLNITAAERRWYGALGIDPYTDNQVLRKTVKSYSRIEGLTSFGMRFAGIPQIPGARELQKTLDLVWETDPWELRKMNRDKLLAAGISEDVARKFEDNPYLSLTMQTGFLQALEQLEGVEGREHLLARALDVQSKDGGQTLMRATALLLMHHRGERPLAEILAGARLPVARSVDGRLVVALPADALFWTEGMAKSAGEFAELYSDDPATIRELWVVGEVSDRFEAEAVELGWKVLDRWQPAAPEKGAQAAGSEG